MDTKHTNSTEADPHGLDQHAPGAKLDAGKVRPWLMISGFSRALQAVAVVTTKGAEKYTPDGWMHVPNGKERYMDAMGRHALALGSGETFDKDTGAHHKAQMIWNLLASLELELREAEAWELSVLRAVPQKPAPSKVQWTTPPGPSPWNRPVGWYSTCDVTFQEFV